MTQPEKNALNRVRQSANRAIYERQTLYAVLDASPVGHVAVVDQGRPISIPSAIARIDDALYLHGSNSSRLFKCLAAGAPVCVSVCLLDGLVVARSAFHCSMNYRSAVVHGVGEAVGEAQKTELLDAFTEKLIPGSHGHFRPHLAKEIKATTLIKINLDQAAVKIRAEGPVDDEEDINLPIWAGVVPLAQVRGTAEPACDLAEGIAVPDFAQLSS